jgi:hypothetical protein
MKTCLFFLIICYSFATWGQEPVPRMQKYPVLETGCSYYLPDSTEFELSLSEDGAKVITGEVLFGDYYFSTITVEFVDGTVTTEEDKQIILQSYLEYLMSTFEITEAAGFGWGHTLDSNPNAIGVIDYWVDSEGTQFAVKGWCDESYLAVLFLYGSEEYPHFNVQQMFLDGFRFPE